ncbi:hypothetical protein BGZ50_009350 [Haplosporangium sp. Z 11]|nr:hypothetical protein BGZ50_009350 [Haplosporangium sp. Z 11]
MESLCQNGQEQATHFEHSDIMEHGSLSDALSYAPVNNTSDKNAKGDDGVSNTSINALSEHSIDMDVTEYDTPRWRFKVAESAKGKGMDEDIFSNEPMMLNCSEGFQKPARIPASTRFTSWSVELSEDDKGLYDIVLGVAVADLKVLHVESIIFTVEVKDLFPRNEAIIPFVGSADSTFAKWKFHNQFNKYFHADKLTITMEIRMSAFPDESTDAGALELHFIELRPVTPGIRIDDPSLTIYRPYLWSIDVNSNTKPVESEKIDALLKTIISYDISADGRVAAILVVTDTCLFLQLWDIDISSDSGVLHSAPATEIEVALEGEGQLWAHFWGLSLNWDGSQLVLFDARALYLEGLPQNQPSIFEVYCIQPASSPVSSTTQRTATSTTLPPSSASSGVLSPSDCYQHCPDLKGFSGYGKFHTTALEHQNITDELFIAWTNDSVKVYSAFGQWQHLRTLSFAGSNCVNPVLACYGPHLAWIPEKNDVISIWDIDQGSLVHVLLSHQPIKEYGMKAAFSHDGTMLAIYRDGLVTVHWMATGAVFGSYRMPEQADDIYGFHFINNDTQLMTHLKCRDKDIAWGPVALILDVVSMTVVDRYLNMGYLSQIYHSDGSDSSRIASYNGSKLDIICLSDRIVQPYSYQQHDCKWGCDGWSPFDQQPMEYISPCGLHFQAEPYPKGFKIASHSIVVSVSSRGCGPVQKLVVPMTPISLRGYWVYEHAAFLGRTQQFVVVTSSSIMLWSLPKTMGGDFELLLFWVIMEDDEIERVIKDGSFWNVCDEHHQLHAQLSYRNIDETWLSLFNFNIDLRPRRSRVFRQQDARYFLTGLLGIIEIFREADETCKRAILRYVNTHVNTYPIPEDCTKSVMGMICADSPWNRGRDIQSFAAALLEEPFGRWIPKPDLDYDQDPLVMLTKRARKDSQVMGFAVLIIKYCIRQAKINMDRQYLAPVLRCLGDLVDPALHHTDIAHHALHQLAYFPVKNRSFILDHHIIAHPPELRLHFWTPNTRPLLECKDPILQLAKTWNHDPKNEFFARPLFVASFDMLWKLPGSTDQGPSKSTSILKSRIKALFSLIWQERPATSTLKPISMVKALFYVMCHQLKPSADQTIQCHDFSLEMLDNPAIAALVENTIGFKYWLLRFISQFSYYVLVLTAVFMQIYHRDHQTLLGVFVAIAVCSCAFIWLELIQLIRAGKKKYFSSMYNPVDLVVFGLPLLGSINQIIIYCKEIENYVSHEINAWLLSFSVIFIALHLLFELRVSRTVCHFVTIIVRILSNIKVFFFIFIGGTLAFTTAIMHVLHACAFTTCIDPDPALVPGPDAEPKVMFPKHFYKAISSTFFLMGGRYDPVNDDLDSNNWAFHTLMIVYFFFTVIVMLNVLIGFRESHDCFPKEIFFSATPQQVKDYEAKYLGKKGGPDTFDNDDSHQFSGDITSGTDVEKSITETSSINARDLDAKLKDQKESLTEEFKKELQQQEKSMKEDFKKELQEQEQSLKEDFKKELEKQLSVQHGQFSEQMAEQKRMMERISAMLASTLQS